MKPKLAKLNASQDAEQCLDRMLQAINTDYSGGRVTKTQLLSWIIVHFEKTLASKIAVIRNDHFDAVAHLENLIKQAKQAKRQGVVDTKASDLLAVLSTQLKPNSKQRGHKGARPVHSDTKLDLGGSHTVR
jgi:hypothetical protein